MRRRVLNSGRWRVERERHRLADPAPPTRETEVLVGKVIPGLIKRMGIGDELWLRELEDRWPELVGPAVAVHTRPGRYEKGALIVFVDSSGWLNELKRYAQKEMLNRLQERFTTSKIRWLRLDLDPECGMKP
jgi:predicted nucleic acid-binding Zn ribbon protein